MSNKDSKKLLVRIVCLVLAGLMVAGVATTAIFMIIAEIEKNKDHNHLAAYEQAELPKYDEGWTV